MPQTINSKMQAILELTANKYNAFDEEADDSTTNTGHTSEDTADQRNQTADSKRTHKTRPKSNALAMPHRTRRVDENENKSK